MKWLSTICLVMGLLSFSIQGCQQVEKGDSPKTKLVLTGSSTIAPLVLAIGKQFEQIHPGIRIDVQTGGSSRGMADAQSGLADIGMASRSLRESEHALIPHVIARDGIALIAHQSNPVKGLKQEQVIGIFTGVITNWKEVGGRDTPITVVTKAEGRGTLDMFLAYFQLKSSSIKAQVVIGDNEQGIKTVMGNPNAIGFVSIGTAEYDATHGVPIQLLALDSIPASLATVQDGSYPLSRSLLLVTKTVPKGLAKDFLDFALSSQTHDLITQYYFVPVTG